MEAHEQVHAAWQSAAREGHVGMSAALRIVAAVANTDDGRRALAEILAGDERVAIVDPDALSYLRISRDLPLPPRVVDHRADGYFRTRFYTGTRLSKTHRVRNPKEFLYFNFAIVMLIGTLDDVVGVRDEMRGSRYDPVLARTRAGEKAIGIVMVNEFRDTTFGPYNEVIFMALAVPQDSSSRSDRVVEYVNAFSLQIPLDRGATTYAFKLWLNELSPIDGGNDYLGTNKELGYFQFEDRSDGMREFRSWDKNLSALVSGAVPRTVTAESAHAGKVAYAFAAQRAGTTLPSSTVTTIPVASRPDEDVGRPASKWAFAVDWRQIVLHEVAPGQVGLRFGESAWAKRFGGFGFRPALSFYAPSGVGQILQHVGDCPFSVLESTPT